MRQSIQAKKEKKFQNLCTQTIENLPKDFVSSKTFPSLCCPLLSTAGTTALFEIEIKYMVAKRLGVAVGDESG